MLCFIGRNLPQFLPFFSYHSELTLSLILMVIDPQNKTFVDYGCFKNE